MYNGILDAISNFLNSGDVNSFEQFEWQLAVLSDAEKALLAGFIDRIIYFEYSDNLKMRLKSVQSRLLANNVFS